VLDAMGKPHIEAYKAFQRRFYGLTKSMNLEQYLVPYLMSSHPGSTIKDAIALACFLKEEGLRPEQVQDFYPTPGTLSTCMYYTGLDPYTLQPIYVPRTSEEKAEQRALLQYFKPENHGVIRAALRKANRRDLIGSGPHCLVPAEASGRSGSRQVGKGKGTAWNGKSGGGRHRNQTSQGGKGAKRYPK